MLCLYCIMKTIFHKAEDRGFANHGWLKAAHSFSFASWYDREKINFGKLRVLNDDIVAPARGFDLHQHHDMEIITIPLSGSIRHRDNIGNQEIISVGDVQVMSAGSGIWHSEHNASATEELNLFQIWIITNKTGHNPRYDQKKFNISERIDKWQLLVSPDGRNDSLWVNQNAFISVFDSKEVGSTVYNLNDPSNGVYFMLTEGEAEIGDLALKTRDAAGFRDISEILAFSFIKPSKILAIEIPML